MNDKKILDYLKEAGVDTSKLMGKNSNSVDDENDNDTEESMPAALPASMSGPSIRDGRPSIALQQAPNPPIDTVTTPPIFDPQTHQQLLAAGTNGPSPTPASVLSAADEDDSDQDDKGNLTKSKFSVSGKGSVNNAQKQALQAAINGAGFTNNTVEGLKAAQDEANDQKSQTNLLRGVAQIAQGGAGMNFKAKDVNIDNTLANLKGLDKQADEGVQNFKDLGEQEKNDPKSAASVGLRQVAKIIGASAGFNIPDNLSYNQLKETIPDIEKYAVALENRTQNNKNLALKYASLAEYKKQGAAGKADQVDTKRLDTANKLITSGLASSRSGFGKDAANLMAVQNAKALLEGGNLDDIDNRQITETARVLDRILSGGSATISGTEHLTPETARMYVAKKLEFYTNKRQGAGAGSFLENTMHTLDREQAVAEKRTQATMQQALGSYKDIAKRNPEQWDSMISSHPEIANIMNSESLQNNKTSSKTLTTSNGVSSANAAPANGHAPGDIVSVQGKQYKVAADGNSLEEI